MDKKSFIEFVDFVVEGLDEYIEIEPDSNNFPEWLYKRYKKPLEDRKQEFIESLKPHLHEFGTDLVNSFFVYWTEIEPNGRKMRWEKQKTWDVKKRLITWRKNNQRFNTINLASKLLRNRK